MLYKLLVFVLIACAVSTASGSGTILGQLQDRSHGLNAPVPPQGRLYPRQTPIVVAPPSGFRTPPAPQPTSLNYWWPYGPNGVNPTATATPISSPEATEMEETEAMDDTSTDIRSSTSPTVLPSAALSTLVSTVPTTETTKIEVSTTANPSEQTERAEPTTSGNDTFSVATLLPLFIILGVLATATLVGWAYGRCTRRHKRDGEPSPGGPDIGGKPYEGGDYEHDTIRPPYSLGFSWVDASRIQSQRNLGSGAYYAIQQDYLSGELGTPSKNEFNRRESHNWFPHKFSGRKRTINSPSGEKGLNAYPIHDRQMPFSAFNASNSGSESCPSPPQRTQLPKTLRVINASPTTGLNMISPITSAQTTPPLSASRHASLRRQIVNRLKEDNKNGFTTKTSLEGAFSGFDHEGQRGLSEDGSIFKGDPHKRFPGRCYMSPGAGSNSSVWSPDPEMHRERMHRLRLAAEASYYTPPLSDPPASPSRPGHVDHQLPPVPAVLLSPPLQPHLFFTQINPDDSECDDASEGAISKFHFTGSGPSRNLTRHSNESGFDKDDSFMPRVAPKPTSWRVRKGKARAQRHLESTETLPLSPELRGAAMTKLDEIVKSHWSIRNLAEVPQSPTLYGALNPSLGHHTKIEDGPQQAGIEELLLAGPGTSHA
ncbi:hypothetical protein OPQ81_004678 [Rhizoctonia solani]|nr:hypothetical protein OPQ81_004678 [Rhizoctonia solani]